jgi:hypothetical protein
MCLLINSSDNLSGTQNYLLEPNNFFVEKYPVAMASCLVDITHEVTNKVRLMKSGCKE